MEEISLETVLLIVWSTIMGILQITIAILLSQGSVWGPSVSLMQLSGSAEMTASISVLLVVTAMLWFALAFGLLRMEKWAFWLAIVLLILSAPTIISLVFLIYLVLNRSKFE
jgi:hypothetical protein